MIPYISSLREEIRRVCKEYHITTAFKSGKTLRSQLSKAKDKSPTDTD